jgi:hypothetical protein
VMSKRQEMPKWAFSAELEKVKNIKLMVSPLGHQVEGHL